MEDHPTRRRTWLFIALLLLGGALHSNDPDEYHFAASVIYCAEYLIYAGLMAYSLPTQAREEKQNEQTYHPGT